MLCEKAGKRALDALFSWKKTRIDVYVNVNLKVKKACVFPPAQLLKETTL